MSWCNVYIVSTLPSVCICRDRLGTSAKSLEAMPPSNLHLRPSKRSSQREELAQGTSGRQSPSLQLTWQNTRDPRKGGVLAQVCSTATGCIHHQFSKQMATWVHGTHVDGLQVHLSVLVAPSGPAEARFAGIHVHVQGSYRWSCCMQAEPLETYFPAPAAALMHSNLLTAASTGTRGVPHLMKQSRVC